MNGSMVPEYVYKNLRVGRGVVGESCQMVTDCPLPAKVVCAVNVGTMYWLALRACDDHTLAIALDAKPLTDMCDICEVEEWQFICDICEKVVCGYHVRIHGNDEDPTYCSECAR